MFLNIQNVSIQNNNSINNSNSERIIINEKLLEKEFYKYTKTINNSSEINECNICFKNINQLASFKCGCSLQVCKECYIKCKKMSNKCPGCRTII